VADYFVLRRGRWDVSDDAPPRLLMLVPWIAGFVVYQLVNPGFVGVWQRFWVARQHDLGFVPPSWSSASILSFVASFAIALAIGSIRRDRPRR